MEVTNSYDVGGNDGDGHGEDNNIRGANNVCYSCKGHSGSNDKSDDGSNMLAAGKRMAVVATTVLVAIMAKKVRATTTMKVVVDSNDG